MTARDSRLLTALSQALGRAAAAGLAMSRAHEHRAEIAHFVLRRIQDFERQRVDPRNRDAAMRHLADGLVAKLEKEPKLVGPRIDDYRRLAAELLRAFAAVPPEPAATSPNTNERIAGSSNATADAAVRAAGTGDLEGILALYRELRPHDPALAPDAARAAFDGMLARADVHLIVCEVQGALVATCMLAEIPNLANGARPLGIIEHVVTLPAHRGRGHARRVLEHALALAWSRGCCKVMLLSGAQRAGAHALYRAAGFDGDAEHGFVAKPPRAD